MEGIAQHAQGDNHTGHAAQQKLPAALLAALRMVSSERLTKTKRSHAAGAFRLGKMWDVVDVFSRPESCRCISILTTSRTGGTDFDVNTSERIWRSKSLAQSLEPI